MAVTGTVDRIARSAGRGAVPVHVALGHGGDPVLAALRASDRVDVVSSPRHASLLVVAGHVPRAAVDALRATHDQVPAPRASLVVDADTGDVGLPAAVALGHDGLVERLVAVHHDVLAGRWDDPALGPVHNPVDWQGVGPHGQGGEGMMGGVPWGRPMVMPPVEGRDGLALDRLQLELGPFLAGLPPLLVLRVGLQGDVLEEAAVDPVEPDSNPAGPGAQDPTGAPGGADPELVALAELLALVGLAGLATRTARLASGRPSTADVAGLRRRLDRWFGLRAATDGVGRLDLPGLSGDVTDRWRRWLDRVEAGVGDGEPNLAEPVDPDELGRQLVGMELGEALLTLASVRPQLAAATSGSGVVT